MIGLVDMNRWTQLERNGERGLRSGSKVLVMLLLLLASLSFGFSSNGFAKDIASQPDVRKYNLGLGKSVFFGKCVKCHGDVGSGAPQLANIQDWVKRLAVPVDTLIEHAVNGHGEMPPKGGFKALTNRKVSAAVAYIVDQGRRLMMRSNGEVFLDQAEVCGKTDSPKSCRQSQVNNTLLLQMLWLMTGKNQKI